MIKTFTNDKNDLIPCFSFPSIWNEDLTESLRDALSDILHNIVSYKDPKEGTDPYSLYLLTEMINELTKDVDNINKKKGGSQC